jgi:hypothetical protein
VTYTFEEVEVVVEEEADVPAVEEDVTEETGALLGAAGEESATPEETPEETPVTPEETPAEESASV